jgi:hypothetical protein
MADDQNKYTQEDIRDAEKFVDAVRQAQELFSSIGNELGKQRTEVQIAAQGYRSIGNNLRKLYDETSGISNLTSDQLYKLKSQNETYLKTIEAQADRLMGEKKYNAIKGVQNEIDEEGLKLELENEEINQRQYNLLLAKINKYSAEKTELNGINEQIKVREEYEGRINNLTSITSATLKSTQGILKSLGAQSLGDVLNLQEAKKEMASVADEIARAKTISKESVTMADRLKVSFAGLRSIGKGLVKSLFSFEAIVAAAAQGSKNINMFQKELGVSYEAAQQLNDSIALLAYNTDNVAISSGRLRKSFSALTKETGLSAKILNEGTLVSMTEMTEQLGLSTEQAANLSLIFGSQGQDAGELLDTAVKTADTYAKQNRLSMSGNQLLTKMSNVSLAVATNLGKNPKSLMAAVAAATKLGVKMETLNSIASSLLDFESSIEAEMKAQVLTGKRLDLSRARAFAMQGDQEKMAEEIGKQEAIREAFATKNVFAQKAAADSIGISVEQLAEMNQQNELNRLSAKKYLSTEEAITLQGLKRQDAAKKLFDQINRVKDILIDAATRLTPYLDKFADFAATPFGGKAALFGIGLLGVSKIFPGLISGIAKATARLVGWTTATKAADAASQNLGKTQSLTSKTSMFSKINTTALIKGAAAMAIAAGGIFLFGKAIQELEKVKDYEAVAKGLGSFVITMGLTTAIMSKFAPVAIEAAAALTIAAGGIFVFAKALQEFDKIKSWENIAGGLLAFGVSLAATSGILSLFTPLAYPAAAALVAFGAAIALMGVGVNLASRGFAIVTDSLSTLSSINLMSVGAGLASVGTGMMAMMSGSLLGGLGAMAVLGTIATLASPLSKSASAVQLLANSFGKLGENIDSLDTDKLNDIKEIVVSDTMTAPIAAAAANIGELIGTISGGGEPSNNKELLAEIKAMRAAIESGGTVYIDSKAAGSAAVLNNFKS